MKNCQVQNKLNTQETICGHIVIGYKMLVEEVGLGLKTNLRP